MRELHIFPCADTLLYIPVYLTIDTLRENTGLVPKKEPKTDPDTNACVWDYNDLRVVLHPASGGDEKAIQDLVDYQREHKVSCVAVADPMLALRSAGPDQGLRIVATFINRIALSSVFKEPLNNLRKAKAWWEPLSKLREDIHQRGRLLGGEFQHYRTHLKVAFCEQGETNKCLLQHFLGVTSSDAMVQDFGAAEFEVVVKDQSHVSFTAAPWLGEACSDLFNVGKYKILTENWLPSIPYPFSSIISTQESWEMERVSNWKGPIGIFIRHMLIAVAMLARYRDRIAFALYRKAGEFRNFGLPAQCHAKHHTVIMAAVRHLVERDYLSEDLGNTWVGWDFATEASTHKPINRLSWTDAYQPYVRMVEREKMQSFWRSLADDEEFWKNDFRNCMRAYMNSHRLAGTEKVAVPLYV